MTRKTSFLRILGYRKLAVVFGTGAFVIASVSAPTQQASNDREDPKRLAEVAGAGMMGGHTFQYVEQLSDDIGARVTGSPDSARAIDWGLKSMRSIGLEDVHSEPWQLWRGWTRGVAEVWLISPNRRKLTADSMGWVGSTAVGGVDADVVPVNLDALADEISKNSSDWNGKVLLVRQTV